MLHIWLPHATAPLQLWSNNHNAWLAFDNWQQLVAAVKQQQKNAKNSLDTCLYIPSVEVLSLQKPLSAKQLKQLGETGLTYLFEDISLTPADELQVRHVSHANMSYLVALSQSNIQRYQQAAALVNLNVQAILPDFLLLPIPKVQTGNQATSNANSVNTPAADSSSNQEGYYYAGQHTQLIRLSAWQGLGVVNSQLVLSRLPQLTKLWVMGEGKQALLTEAEQQLQTNTPADRPALVASLEKPKPIQQPNRHGFNFTQANKKRGLSPYWQVVAAVLVAAMLMQVIYDGASWYKYKQLTQQTQKQSEQQFLAWFPNEGRVTSLAKQLESKLSGTAEKNTQLMQLLASVSPIIRQSNLTADNLSFANNQLDISLKASNISQLDQLAKQLNNQGIAASLGKVTPVGTDVLGIVHISP